jgi:hypothetical protein
MRSAAIPGPGQIIGHGRSTPMQQLHVRVIITDHGERSLDEIVGRAQ